MGKSRRKDRAKVSFLRDQYEAFLEEDRKRKERNEEIVRRLETMRFVTSAASPVSARPPGQIQTSPVKIRENLIRPSTKNISTRISAPWRNAHQTNAYVSLVPQTQAFALKEDIDIEQTILREISKKFILIPKVRNEANYEVLQELPQKSSTNVTGDEWKIKYDILEKINLENTFDSKLKHGANEKNNESYEPNHNQTWKSEAGWKRYSQIYDGDAADENETMQKQHPTKLTEKYKSNDSETEQKFSNSKNPKYREKNSYVISNIKYGADNVKLDDGKYSFTENTNEVPTKMERINENHRKSYGSKAESNESTTSELKTTLHGSELGSDNAFSQERSKVDVEAFNEDIDYKQLKHTNENMTHANNSEVHESVDSKIITSTKAEANSKNLHVKTNNPLTDLSSTSYEHLSDHYNELKENQYQNITDCPTDNQNTVKAEIPSPDPKPDEEISQFEVFDKFQEHTKLNDEQENAQNYQQEYTNTQNEYNNQTYEYSNESTQEKNGLYQQEFNQVNSGSAEILEINSESDPPTNQYETSHGLQNEGDFQQQKHLAPQYSHELSRDINPNYDNYNMEPHENQYDQQRQIESNYEQINEATEQGQVETYYNQGQTEPLYVQDQIETQELPEQVQIDPHYVQGQEQIQVQPDQGQIAPQYEQEQVQHHYSEQLQDPYNQEQTQQYYDQNNTQYEQNNENYPHYDESYQYSQQYQGQDYSQYQQNYDGQYAENPPHNQYESTVDPAYMQGQGEFSTGENTSVVQQQEISNEIRNVHIPENIASEPQ